MAEPRVDLRWKRFFETFDLFGDFAESFGMAIRIAAAFLVANNGETIPKGGGEVG